MLKAKNYLNLYWKQSTILLGYPLVLAFILEITVREIGYSTFLNLIENILFAIIILLVINKLAGLKFGKKLANFIIITYYAILFVETGLYLLFQTRFNAAYIYIVLNTNYIEIKEFSSVYYERNIIWLLLFFIPLLSFFPKKIYKRAKAKSNSLVFSSVFILIILGFLKYSKLIDWNLPYVTVKSYVQYQKQMNVFDEFNKEEKNIQIKLVTQNDVIVVVIGESTTRRHMNIYGYQRKTTPRLKELSDSLAIYKNVISSHVYTTASIFNIFTLSNYENPNAPNTLIDYLKNAGYQVFWLSNHRPVGFYDNLVSRLASAADESFFLSFNDFRHNTLYDEVLIPKLNERLSKKGKKVIFMHLIGNHYAYKKRYPKIFSEFTSKEKNSKNEIIDTYDNAILYNDFIVSEIIKTVNQKAQKSAVIYFSDHGEEVYDIVDFFGHFQDKPTSTMYEVPFLVYMSPTFEKPNDFIIDESRRYMLDDFPHSLTHFMGIESELLKKSRSIFSTNFQTRKRIIQDSLDFESFKLNENK